MLPKVIFVSLEQLRGFDSPTVVEKCKSGGVLVDGASVLIRYVGVDLRSQLQDSY